MVRLAGGFRHWLHAFVTVVLVAGAAPACSDPQAPNELTPEPLAALAQLGQRIFEDPDLSIGRNQSCASCHAAEWGFRGSDEAHQGGVFQGSIAGRFGERAPLSAAYATPAPVFAYSDTAGYVGGNFWDGRATGAELGDPTAEQARGPFLNPVEQGLPDAACVVYRVSGSAYAGLYRELWGEDINAIAFPADTDARCAEEGSAIALSAEDRERVRVEYDRVARSISAFEASPAVSAFTSKFDAWIRGEARLTQQEQMGFMLFQGPARCDVCHALTGSRPLFTDFGYHNLGTPANPENPVYARDPAFVDLGLGGAGGAAPGRSQWGLVRTPTLRNVDRRPAPGSVKRFMHNGALVSLKEVVRFYNTRDVLPVCPDGAARSAWGVSCWPAASVPENVNTRDLGRLGLNGMQEDAIVAFLRTLSDGYTAAAP
jgi:cytochrome c peroxidase